MERLAPTGDAMTAEPSPELWGRFIDMMDLAFENPVEFERKVAMTQRVIEAHRSNSKVLRLRSALYDAKVARAREEFEAWFEASVAVIRMQARLSPPP